MDLCHEKHSELPPDQRKYKGRVVFRGDQVKDETGYFAVFSEQGSSASHMAAAKTLDAIAHMPNCGGENSDAIGAYTQVVLDDMTGISCTETWISLPSNRRPASWSQYTDPVCRLRLNLYGHPLAGLYWEKHCQQQLFTLGFEKITGWECLYVHRTKKLFLSVYVDDFKMAGLKVNLKPMWTLLQSKLDLDPPTALHGNVYLGCTQWDFLAPYDEIKIKTTLFHSLFASNPSEASSLSHVSYSNVTERGVNSTSDCNKAEGNFRNNESTKAYYYDMSGHATQCVERYLELSNKLPSSLKYVATPSIDDHQLSPEDFTTKGELAPVAARIVLKALYLARMKRADCLWAVNALAREVTKWNVACDKRLHRLMSYIHHTSQWMQKCWVSDPPKECKIALYADASFAGDLRDSKSTTGSFMAIIGPRTFVPISWMCKKQGAVSHSSSEAEVISLDASLRMEGISMLMLWDTVIDVIHGKPAQSNKIPDHQKQKLDIDYVPTNVHQSNHSAQLLILEDNDAVIKMILKGRSPTMKHVSRTHRVDLDWLFERIREDPGINIKYINTKDQIADILTKASFTAQQWLSLCMLAQIGTIMNNACTNSGSNKQLNNENSIPTSD